MWWILFACTNSSAPDSGRQALDSGLSQTDCPDADSDGACAGEDCDDNDWTSYPGAPEVCDGVDNDCNGAVDDDAGLIYYADRDGDGYGAEPIQTCDPPSQYADNGADCDDNDARTYPGAQELEDGKDNDCDGRIDEDAAAATEISLRWSSSGLEITISGSASRYEIGMAETGAGSDGWFGESCIPGQEPWGYDDYDYDVCHTLSATGGFLDHVSSLSRVGDGSTLFNQGLADDITYFIADTSSTDCWMSGHAPSYYDDFNCQRF